MSSERRREGLLARGHCCLTHEDTQPVDPSFLTRLRRLFTLRSVFWVYAHGRVPMDDSALSHLEAKTKPDNLLYPT